MKMTVKKQNTELYNKRYSTQNFKSINFKSLVTSGLL